MSDHTIVRAGIRSIIEEHPGMMVVGEAPSRIEDLGSIQDRPDVILIDLDSSNGDSHQHLANVIQKMQPTCVLVLTSRRDPEFFQRIAQQGCMGVVLKDKPIAVLLKAIERVSAGEIWFDRSTMAGVIRDIKHPNGSKSNGEAATRIATLTKREREVIGLMCEGLKTRQLAERMFISETTVRHHLTSVYDKLEVADRFELVFWAYKHGLATPPPR
jgi:two-component system, NarL family, nitrate/nitrite response regulator NarL